MLFELPDLADRVLRHFHPVMAASALTTRPRRVEVAGQAIALFRDGSGRPAAIADRCAHRLAPLSAGRVAGGQLVCPYHGWAYDRDGRGATPERPEATRCTIPAFQVVERHGTLWLGGAAADPASAGRFDVDGFAPCGAIETVFPAPFHVAFDNFSENEHTPYVHTRFGWDAARAGAVEFECDATDDTTSVFYRAPQRASALARLFGVQPGDLYVNRWETRFDPPRTAYDIYWEAPGGARRPLSLRVVIYFVPETARTTRFHSFLFVRTEGALRLARPLVERGVRLLVGKEVADDARFIATVADTPYALDGMKLSRFDRPLVKNRERLERVYLGLHSAQQQRTDSASNGGTSVRSSSQPSSTQGDSTLPDTLHSVST